MIHTPDLKAEEIRPAINLGDLKNADGLATALVESKNPIHFVHIGETLPANLRYVMLKLKLAGSSVTLDWYKNENEVVGGFYSQLLENSPLLSQNDWVSYQPEKLGLKATLEPSQVSYLKLAVRKFFGIPNGLSLWFQFAKSKEDRISSHVNAAISSTIAGLSMGAAFYLSAEASTLYLPYLINDNWITNAAAVTGAATSLAAWVYFNIYYWQSINEVMFQGKKLTINENGQVGVDRSMPFAMQMNFYRGIVTNSIVMGGVFGALGVAEYFAPGSQVYWDWVTLKYFSLAAASTSLINATVNVFARSRIDTYIQQRTPTTKDESGQITVQPGEWSEGRARVTRVLWEMGYGFPKNLHLVGWNRATDAIYFGLAAINLGWMAADRWLKRPALTCQQAF